MGGGAEVKAQPQAIPQPCMIRCLPEALKEAKALSAHMADKKGYRNQGKGIQAKAQAEASLVTGSTACPAKLQGLFLKKKRKSL